MSAKVRLETILPDKDFFSTDRVLRELKGALDHTGNIIRDDFKKTVRTWRRKVMFTKVGPRNVGGGKLAVDVFTDNLIYFFVSGGTRRHPIPKTPKTTGFLVFQSGYTAKTRPGVVGSRAGGPRGPIRRARQVIHPGTKARDFDKVIAKRRQRNLINLSRLAVNRSFRFGGSR